MSIVTVLDILTDDPQWAAWSSSALERCANDGSLCINAMIYAEVSISFARIEEVEEALPPAWFERPNIPLEAAFLAGKAFLSYRRKGRPTPSTLPDFFIRAHATVAGLRLLTRDARRYETYFPTLEIISPR